MRVWTGGQLANPLGLVFGWLTIPPLIALFFLLLYAQDAIDWVSSKREPK